MKKKFFINFSLSIGMVVISLFFGTLLLLFAIMFDKDTNLAGYIVGLIIYSLFFVGSLILILIAGFHRVTLFWDHIEYSKIFKKETIFFREIKSVRLIKKAVISSVIFRVPTHEDYLVILGHQKVEIPAKLFHYNEQENTITYRNQTGS